MFISPSRAASLATRSTRALMGTMMRYSTAAPVFPSYDRLKGKVCVVTGGGAGLGLAIAGLFFFGFPILCGFF
jgi:hypothetical protein